MPPPNPLPNAIAGAAPVWPMQCNRLRLRPRAAAGSWCLKSTEPAVCGVSVPALPLPLQARFGRRAAAKRWLPGAARQAGVADKEVGLDGACSDYGQAGWPPPRRVSWRPALARGVTVFASLRLRCGAQPGVAPPPVRLRLCGARRHHLYIEEVDASLALARRFRLTPCSAAWVASARWTSGGIRTRNSPL